MSDWLKVLLRFKPNCVLEVSARVAEPTPKTSPVEGERPVFCPPAGWTDEKATAPLVFRLMAKVKLVCATPPGKFAEPLCTEEPSLSCTVCQKISEMSSGAPEMLRSKEIVFAEVHC